MKVRPKTFKPAEMYALLKGMKTQHREVVKPTPDFIYSLTDDAIRVVHSNMEAIHELDNSSNRRGIAVDSCFPELGLHGWFRWQDILSDEIQRLWGEGVRGLVCVSRSQNKEGVFECITVSRRQESNEVGTPDGLYGVPWMARTKDIAGASSGRKPREQYSNQSCVGNTDRKLGGQKGARERLGVGEAPLLEVGQSRALPSKMGYNEGALQPESGGENAWNEPVCRTKDSKLFPGLMLWVRENVELTDAGSGSCMGQGYGFNVLYKADGHSEWCWATKDTLPKTLGNKPNIHMHRWASRLTLEINDVRVERLQDISEEDALAEGVEAEECLNGEDTLYNDYSEPSRLLECPIESQKTLWESIYGPGSWDANPWVWVIEFNTHHCNVDDFIKARAA